MSLVRWFRKNNSKIMAVVVIVIMFGFIGGSYLSYLGRKSSPLNKPVAFYLGEEPLTQNDLSTAQTELTVLAMVAADELLRAQDIEGIALAELLFTTKQQNVDLVRFTRQIITTQEYRIPGAHIGNVYERSMIPAFYWALLKAEAMRAGVKIANREAYQLLNQSIPVLTEGRVTYPQIIENLARRGYREDAVLDAVGKLLAVLQYSRYVCSGEDLTIPQMTLEAAYNLETIDANIVSFNASVFAKEMPEPSEEEVLAHFEKHKDVLPGHLAEGYPYGFGYKIPDRVQLEYLAISLADVKGIVEEPTAEETESYYQQRLVRFTRKVPSDPNDPDSPLDKTETIPYAEVAQTIADELMNTKIFARSESILEEAMVLAEIDLLSSGLDTQEATSEELEKYAADYGKIAERLGQNHGIKAYSGRTGMLGAKEINTDSYLSTMTLEGHGYFPIRVAQIAFAVDELKASELGPFDASKVKMFQNFGTAKDVMARVFSNIDDPARQMCAILRVVKVDKSRVPESIDESWDVRSIVLDPNDKSDEDVYSVRKTVVEDLKKLKAMETAKAKAGEFIGLAKSEGWDTAVAKFNELYPKDPNDDDEDPNTFALQPLSGSRRSSQARFDALAIMNRGYPNARLVVLAAKLETMLYETLYSLIPAESTSISEPNEPLEFKPATSYLCVKDLSINRLWKESFESIKPLEANRLDKVEAQTFSVVHFDPNNILERMGFRWADPQAVSGDPNSPDVNATGQDEGSTDAAEQAEDI